MNSIDSSTFSILDKLIEEMSLIVMLFAHFNSGNKAIAFFELALIVNFSLILVTFIDIISKNLLLFKFRVFKVATSKPETRVKEVSEIVILLICLIPLSRVAVLKIGKTFQLIESTLFNEGAEIEAKDVNSFKENVPPIEAKFGTLILTKLDAFETLKSPLIV
ncbi:hypothetical protein WICMUC_005305 [Wickerhamomyces mucosus]|uniref:Uncharacterized protein n=1 Tax=Wickerhamomyces mucosus TaxID=1378264 RepID=A0A9P8T668_9ASCO|nr:hypothetical protein WICMUC_005305 [Wickerhamomyces mucosus]